MPLVLPVSIFAVRAPNWIYITSQYGHMVWGVL